MNELNKSENPKQEKPIQKKFDLISHQSFNPLIIRPLNLVPKDCFNYPIEDCYDEIMAELRKPLTPLLKNLLESESKTTKIINNDNPGDLDVDMSRKKAISFHDQPTYHSSKAQYNAKNSQESSSPGKANANFWNLNKRTTMNTQETNGNSDMNSPFSENLLAKAKQRSTLWKEDDVIAEENEESETVRSNKTNLSVSTKLERTLGRERTNSEENNKGNMFMSSHLAVLYCSTLFVLLRFDECGGLVMQSLKLTRETHDKLGEANLIKLNACLNWIKSNFESSLSDFSQAYDLFIEVGCLLGQAVCEAAMGYIKGFVLAEDTQATNSAIKHLEKALEVYKQLDHIFGIYFMNRWLSFIKNKIPGLKSQSDKHAKEARKALSQPKAKKDVYGHLHKAGYFVLRWMGDSVSIFLEIANICDSKPEPIKKKSREDDKSFIFTNYSGNLSKEKLSSSKFSKLWSYASKTTINELEALKAPGGLATLKEEDELSNKDGNSFIVESSSDSMIEIAQNNTKSGDKKNIHPRNLMPSLRKKASPTKLTSKTKIEEEGKGSDKKRK